ncbi:MAG: hypothetical protein MK106_13880 [Mariniblastus sp.]|nr:hypothetical protein [Mariniblastus sp.]
MADFLFQATLSNLIVSSLLAIAAYFIQRRYQAARLANVLWIMVVIKMVTPPLHPIALLAVEPIGTTRAVAELREANTAKFPTYGVPAMTQSAVLPPFPDSGSRIISSQSWLGLIGFNLFFSVGPCCLFRLFACSTFLAFLAKD